jgi:ribosomal protein L37AE/L43A
MSRPPKECPHCHGSLRTLSAGENMWQCLKCHMIVGEESVNDDAVFQQHKNKERI